MTRKLARFLEGYYAQRQDLYRGLGAELTPDSLVFAHPDGSPLDPSVVTHGFGRVAARAGLQSVRFHDLRHTFASLMLLRGAKPKVISEALGHASVAFPVDTYSHIIDGTQRDTMTLLDEILPVGHHAQPTYGLTKDVGKMAASL
jgi:integrase